MVYNFRAMKQKTITVLVGGCFDILHYGHIRFLKKAKTLGNYLVVAIESDIRVRELKGKGRPIHTQKQRKEILESLKFVDKVIVLKDQMVEQDYFNLVQKLKPSIIAITQGDSIKNKKRKQANEIGAKVVEIPKFQSTSTSRIIKILNTD